MNIHGSISFLPDHQIFNLIFYSSIAFKLKVNSWHAASARLKSIVAALVEGGGRKRVKENEELFVRVLNVLVEYVIVELLAMQVR